MIQNFLHLQEKATLSNGLVFAILDEYPVSVGHTLIIPRRCIHSWFDATDEELIAMKRLLCSVKEQLEDLFTPHGFNVGFNHGSVAGQTVYHAHMHVIPRYPHDVENPIGGIRNVIPHLGNYKI